jgi:type I restriction-modification system DNA methylase subunit
MAKTFKEKGDLSFEKKFWEAADKLHKNMDAAEYKHDLMQSGPTRGKIFLKMEPC